MKGWGLGEGSQMLLGCSWGNTFGVLLRIPLYNAECGSMDALFTVQRGEEEGRSFLLLESYILKLLVTFK